jgi:beta-phosphoglucomutase-like phosphatase (HAD superfamily)
MNEVFNVLRKNIASLPLTQSKKELLLNKFSDFKNVYDAFITASDSNEIRLKPHRDLYSIALQQMSIHQNNFNSVIGFEDSESGTIAMRAAGINLAVALPFAQTKGHNLTAASFICNGGLAEVILKHKFFVK